MRVTCLLGLIMVLMSPTVNGQSNQTFEFAWLQELMDSVQNKSTICDDCKELANLKRFYTPSGELRFRLYYLCDAVQGFALIYDRFGTNLSACVAETGDTQCDREAQTSFTFGENSVEIWRCEDNFTCDALQEFDLFPEYEIVKNRISCQEDGFTLTTSELFDDYVWLKQDEVLGGQPSFDARESGEFTVIVSDTSGCLDTSQFYIDLQSSILSISGSTVICEDETQLVASGNESYLWSNGNISDTAVFISPGDYTLIGTDATGCTETIEFSIEDESDRELLLQLPESIYTGQEVSPILLLEGFSDDQISTITWDLTSGVLTCIDCLSPQFIVSEGAELSVMIEDENGCMQFASQNIFPLQAYKEIYASNIFSPNNDGLHETFGLNSIHGTIDILSFEIFDRWGNQVFQRESFAIGETNTSWDGTFEGLDSPSGSYTWMASVRYADGEENVLSGLVTLIR